MEAELARIDLPAVRTPGGQEWTGDPARVQVMYELTPATICTYVGQTRIMGEALERGMHAFVMEDDLCFCSDFWTRWNRIEAFLNEHEWDIFWFGGTFHCNPPVWHKDDLGKDAQLTDTPRIVRTFGIWSTYAYLVNRESISKVLFHLDRILDQSPGVDTSMIELQPDWQTFCFVPGCVKQRDDWSDITHSVSKFSGFERLGGYWWQNYAEDFDFDSFDWAEAR